MFGLHWQSARHRNSVYFIRHREWFPLARHRARTAGKRPRELICKSGSSAIWWWPGQSVGRTPLHFFTCNIEPVLGMPPESKRLVMFCHSLFVIILHKPRSSPSHVTKHLSLAWMAFRLMKYTLIRTQWSEFDFVDTCKCSHVITCSC